MARTRITPLQINNPFVFRARRVASFNTTSGQFVKVPFDTKDIDPNSNFDVTTNVGRYTATVAGNYQINGRLSVNGQPQVVIALYKNGSFYMRGGHNSVSAVNGVVFADVVNLAVSDYIEIYVYTDVANTLEASSSQFSGFLIR